MWHRLQKQVGCVDFCTRAWDMRLCIRCCCACKGSRGFTDLQVLVCNDTQMHVSKLLAPRLVQSCMMCQRSLSGTPITKSQEEYPMHPRVTMH